MATADATNGAAGAPATPDVLRAALEWLPIGILIANGGGAIVFANRAAEQLFGYTRAELLGRTVDVLVPDASRAAHAARRAEFHRRPEARPMHGGREVDGRRKDGAEIPIEVALSPVVLGDTTLVVTSVVDVGARRRLRTELVTARDDRLQFEALVSELGAQFVNLAPDDVDRSIEEALGRVVRLLDLDRGTLFRLQEGSGDFVHTHQWTRPGWAGAPTRVSAAAHFPWHLARVRAGEAVSFTDPQEIPDAVDREHLAAMGTRSGTTLPLTVEGRVWGAASFASVREPRTWSPDVLSRLRVVSLIFANALARKLHDDAVRRAVGDDLALRTRLHEENAYLRQEVRRLTGAPGLVGHSAAMRRVHDQIRQIAGTDSPVLLVGETGTGRSLLAARLHELSPRGARMLVRATCASLTPGFIERDLLGHEDRADGDPATRHIRLAGGSTVFLDEVADLTPDAQAALVRLLQDQPQPGTAGARTHIRVIAATRRHLTRLIATAAFREDLYYALNVFPIHVPPLRERREDIPPLVWRFVDEFSEAYGKPIHTIDGASLSALERYGWPGNARELRNVVERAVIVATSRHLHIPLPPEAAADSRPARRRRARR